jgi:hypothetical protein
MRDDKISHVLNVFETTKKRRVFRSPREGTATRVCITCAIQRAFLDARRPPVQECNQQTSPASIEAAKKKVDAYLLAAVHAHQDIKDGNIRVYACLEQGPPATARARAVAQKFFEAWACRKATEFFLRQK